MPSTNTQVTPKMTTTHRKNWSIEDWADGISVIVPTYKRPDDILRALGSIIDQDTDGRPYEIIVADNDPAGSAETAVLALIDANPQTRVIYTHVPDPGVSNARNGALTQAQGRYIIYLDDDMEAHPRWIAELVIAANHYDAPIVFGPVIAQMPDGDNPLYPHMQPLFCRTGNFADGIIKKTFGTGGCLIDHGRTSLPDPVFDPSLNEVGGEDDALFAHILGHGGRIAWTTKANAIEHIPTHRATPAYVWKRNFAFGQAPTQSAADHGWAGAPSVLKWMGVGIVQTITRAPIYAFQRLTGNPHFVHSYGRLSQAVGKVIWFSGFSPRLYGVDAPTQSSSPAGVTKQKLSP
ncbi:glycosyltransferase family 2 protein [Fretibacter rubidus]|uniref:glycosyltransferase family 2 protein n=1 Tax=Fretibacter rubidus TaxID=570162 RepID=UPI00352ADFD3